MGLSTATLERTGSGRGRATICQARCHASCGSLAHALICNHISHTDGRHVCKREKAYRQACPLPAPVSIFLSALFCVCSVLCLLETHRTRIIHVLNKPWAWIVSEEKTELCCSSDSTALLWTQGQSLWIRNKLSFEGNEWGVWWSKADRERSDSTTRRLSESMNEC